MKKQHLYVALSIVGAAGVLVGATVSNGADAGKAAPARDRATAYQDFAALRTAGDRPSVAEYDHIKAVANQPKLDVDNAAPVASELASIEGARVLANNPTMGRIVVVPATDGDGLCFSQDLPPRFKVQGVSGCTGRLDADGLTLSYGKVGGVKGWVVFGIAADGVDDVTVTTGSGMKASAPVSGNAFMWTSDDEADVPIAVTSEQGAASVERDLPPVA